MKTISRYIMTLALLLTAVGGAWAQDIATPVISGETEFYDEVTVTITCATSDVDIYYTRDGSDPRGDHPAQIDYKNAFTLTETTTVRAAAYSGDAWSAIAEVTFTKQTGPKVTWDAATKTGTFTMPAFDVEIAPIYAPAAQWAKDKEVDQLPTAIEGIFAGTTDAIVKAGTVAMMGKTENPQGIVMYAVTSINQATAPELNAFSADVPTAENIADEGADVLVWYYIQGANTPDGQEATAENTFNDSEICTTPLKVTVLTNKFDIQFNAANANTIETDKATVTVGGTDKTVTEGKLQGVKMGSEVKVKANTGYKFRKVEVKKKAAGPTTITVTWNGADITGTGGGKSFTKDGVTITADDIEFMDKNFIGGGTFTTTLGNFTKIEVTTDGWYASGTGWSGSTWTGNASSVSFSGEIMGYGGGNLKFVFTIEPTN